MTPLPILVMGPWDLVRMDGAPADPRERREQAIANLLDVVRTVDVAHVEHAARRLARHAGTRRRT